MAENEISVVKLSDRQNHMRTGKGLKLVRDLCAQLVGDADSFHGCIWPGNITLNSDKKWILGVGSDVPVAQRTADEVEYLAPEYFWDGAKSAAADVYSLGLFLYAAYNRGRMPFQAKNKPLTDKDRSTALRRRMKGEVISVTGSISAELKAIITKALSYDPEKRFISAAELLTALDDVPEAQAAGGESAVPAADTPVVPVAAAEEVLDTVPAEDISAVDEAPESFPQEETAPAEPVAEEAPEEEALQEALSVQEPVTEEPAGEEIPEETLTETPDAAVSVPEEDILTETPDAEAETAPEEESAPAPFSADAKKYTVRKDYEENLVSSRSSASSRRRRKRVSPLIPILCILAAGILLVVILLLALRSVDNSEANLPVKPSEPYTINASELENKEDPSASVAAPEKEDAQETTPAAEEEDSPAQTGSTSIDGKVVDPAEGTVYVAESGSKLRTGPSTSYDVADSLARGTALELTGTVGEDWSQVKYNGEEYYISNSLISETDPTGKAQAEEAASSQTAPASGDGIGTLEIVQEANVRSGPGTNYDKVGVAKVGSEYTILDVTSDSKWYKIDFGGKTGYINRNMVSVIELDYSATATVISDVNIRSGPGSGYDKMGVAKAGESLTVVGTSNGWYKISYDGKTGYVAGNFVTIR